MSATPPIRPAAARDRAELLRMRRALWPGEADEHEREVDAYLAAAGRGTVALVAPRAGGGLAGFVEVGARGFAEGCLTSPVAFVEGWYVDPDVRRRGVGRALLAAAEAWARGQGFAEIASDAEVDNDVSIAAHRACGYEEIVRVACFRRPLTASDLAAAPGWTAERFSAWLAAYGAAWEARDPEAFARLFAPDCAYYWTPFQPPYVGPPAIAEAFRRATSTQQGIRFAAEVLRVEPARAIARWACTFTRQGRGHAVAIDGILLARAAAGGTCAEFREWWHADEPGTGSR